MARKKTATNNFQIINVSEEAEQRMASQPLTDKERTVRKIAKSAGGFGLGKTAATGYSSGDMAGGAGGNFYSPQLSTDFLEQPQNLRERRAWYRHFYYKNELVGAAIDLHSTIPLSKLRLQRPKAKNQKLAQYSYDFFVDMCDRISLFKRLMEISHEYWLIGGCARIGSLISTDKGMVPVETVKLGDMVLTHAGRYRPVVHTFERHADAIFDIKVWKNPWRNLQVTDEHPLEVLRDGQYSFIRADTLKKGDFIKVSAVKETADISEIAYLDTSKVTPTEYGYERLVTIGHDRDEEANRVRDLLLGWLSVLSAPTVMDRKSLAVMFSCKFHTLNNVLLTLDNSGILGMYKERVGCDGFAKGSRTVWHPVPNATEVASSSYDITRYDSFQAPHELVIDEDFLYVAGYWLGDGTLSRDSYRKDQWGRGSWEICFGDCSKAQHAKILTIMDNILGTRNVCTQRGADGMTTIELRGNPAFLEWWATNFGETSKGSNFKKVPQWVLTLPQEKQLAFLAGLIDSDGCVYSRMILNGSNVAFNGVSRPIMFGIRDILNRLCIPSSMGRRENFQTTVPRTNDTYQVEEFFKITVLDQEGCDLLTQKTVKKFKPGAAFSKSTKHYKVHGGFLALEVRDIGILPGESVYNLEVEEDHTFAIEGYSTHNCFAFVEEHNPYPDGLESEHGQYLIQTGSTRASYLKEKFDITDRDPNYIGWKSITILPPDQVQIKKVMFSEQPLLEFMPDDKTKSAIMADYAEGAFEGLSEASRPSVPIKIRDAVGNGGAIPLDTDPNSGSHCSYLCRKKSQYEVYGQSILERCVQTLLLSDKLRQAQTSIASRHMTPMRVVWAEGLSDNDLDDLRAQVDWSLADPDYSIVANYEIHWDEMNTSGRLLELNTEYEHSEKLLYAGLGVTEELLNGGGMYSGGSKISLELLNIQYMQFREMLIEWIENNLFKPVARKKGFIEYDEFGNEHLIYPKVTFTRLSIRDAESSFEQVFQLYQKGSVPSDVILEMLNIDPDIARQRLEADLFTVNDSTFNEFLRAAYSAAGSSFADKTNISERLATSMGLSFAAAPAADEGGGGGGGEEGGLRFAAGDHAPVIKDPSKDVQTVSEDLQFLLEAANNDPQKIAFLADLVRKRKAAMPAGTAPAPQTEEEGAPA